MTADLSVLLDQLKEKAEKATPGPWENQGGSLYSTGEMIVEQTIDNAADEGYGVMYPSPEDAAYIAATHPQVVAALAEVAQAVENHASREVCPLCREEMWYAHRSDCPLARLRSVLAGEEKM